MSKVVKNISGKTLAIPDIGTVEAGETITVPDDFRNPNFAEAKSGKPEKESTEDAQKEVAPKKK